jgi:FecR protein
MNKDLPPSTQVERRLQEAASLTPAPEGLWERVENKRSKKTFQRHRFALGVAVVTAAAVGAGFLVLRPRSQPSDWHLNGHPIALGEALVATRQPLTLTAAGVGSVQLQPESRLRVLESHKTRQRLALDSGMLKVKVNAPPRLFVVETPFATATDLGCEYTLSASDEPWLYFFRRRLGSALRVVSGYVELEDKNKNVVLVPAGALVVITRDSHQTLPAFEAASSAVFTYDSTLALTPLLKALKKPEDTLTLFHLLPRVGGAERAAVLDKLLTFTTLPRGVTRAQVLALDSHALALWRDELKLLWGGASQLGI